ncbi:MAG: CARDB domain-containing protein [Crocosphaera sp.]|nr:CARDB domain-containing protein [Crocosphaera sp.]
MIKQILVRLVSVLAVTLLCLSSLFTWTVEPARAATSGLQFQYAVKTTCSLLTTFPDAQLAEGTYRTLINIHNPTTEKVTITYKVAVAQRPGDSTNEGSISGFKKVTIEPDQTIAVDCGTIAGFFCPTPGGICIDFGFIDGFLVVYSPVKLDVVSIYTARASRGEVQTMDVETIQPKLVEVNFKDRPSQKEQADLVVREINLSSLSVDCPGGGGTCVTKVEVTIANVGLADAEAFRTRVTFDPGQSVEVFQDFPTGLAQGSSETFTVTTRPGGNCFDPDCTICVTVDDQNQVMESNELNNNLCQTRPG